MRGDDDRSSHLFSYLSPEQRVPADHPLRAISDDDRRRVAADVPSIPTQSIQRNIRPVVPFRPPPLFSPRTCNSCSWSARSW